VTDEAGDGGDGQGATGGGGIVLEMSADPRALLEAVRADAGAAR
jgi:hypothetical protein